MSHLNESESRSKSTPTTSTSVYRHCEPSASYAATTVSSTFHGWTVSVTRGPILSSQCTCHFEGYQNPQAGSKGDSLPVDKSSGAGGDAVPIGKCVFCRYEERLTLKYLPDMVFAQNRLVITSPDGRFGVEFSAVDAVNSIGEEPSSDVKVASAGVWQNARSECLKTFGESAVKYDWTFSPDYAGTVIGDVRVMPTPETLDVALLSQRDPVTFFEEFQLYGDELDDNGCAEMDLKIRVVDAYLFVLLRYYLRVDHVAVKLKDVRLLFEKGKEYMVRECTVREARIAELPPDVSPMDPVKVWTALKPLQTVVEKLIFPTVQPESA